MRNNARVLESMTMHGKGMHDNANDARGDVCIEMHDNACNKNAMTIHERCA